MPKNEAQPGAQQESRSIFVPEARLANETLIVPAPTELTQVIERFRTEHPTGSIWVIGFRANPSGPPLLYLTLMGGPLVEAQTGAPDQDRELIFPLNDKAQIQVTFADSMHKLETPILPLAQIETPQNAILLLVLTVPEFPEQIRNGFFTGERFRITPAESPETNNAILKEVGPRLPSLHNRLLPEWSRTNAIEPEEIQIN